MLYLLLCLVTQGPAWPISNCFPPRAAGVNFWIFITVSFDGGCWYKAKCEMLLRKIDDEKNVENCRFSAKLRNGDGGDMLHDWRHWQLSRNSTIFRWYDTLPTSKTRWQWPGNPNGRSKFCNLHLFTLARSQLMLRRRLHGFWRLPEIVQTACGRRQKHRWRRPGCSSVANSCWRRLLEIAQMARCRRQTHRRRWPGNPNGHSKFRYLRLFTLARSQLMLQQQLHGFCRLSEIVQTACCRCQKHRWRRPSDDQDWSKFRNYENLCLRDQAKNLDKSCLAVRTLPLWWHFALCFPLLSFSTAFVFSYYHSQLLLFSPTKNNFSTTLTPTEKPRYRYWRDFL